jgi:hypothetical protein
VVDDVAELVQDDAVDPARAVAGQDPRQVDGDGVARAAGLSQPGRGGIARRPDAHLGEPVDERDEARRRRPGPGHCGDEGVAVGRRTSSAPLRRGGAGR